MTKKDKKFMRIAEAVSKTSTFRTTMQHRIVHIGAVIVKKNRIISVGKNSKKTHPIQKYYDRYLSYYNDVKFQHHIHAEISAIVNANEDLAGCTLYIYRVDATGKYLKNCRPCDACYALIRKTGIKRIVYTINNGYAEEFVE